MPKGDSFRIHLLLVGFFVTFGLIGYRLFAISYVNHARYLETAQAQLSHVNNILIRGTAYMTDKAGGRVVAGTNKKFPVVSIVPAQIGPEQAVRAASELGRITGVSEESIAKIIASGVDMSRVLNKKLDADQAGAVQELGIKGVSIAYQTDRFYPNGSIAADVLGFLGYGGGSERSGQYGVEAFYDGELSGVGGDKTLASGESEGLFSRLTGGLLGGSAGSVGSVEPQDVVLTIDANVQSFAEDVLDRVVKRWNAAGGSVIVQEPTTGKIVAMADRPTFDPNRYGSYEQQLFLNGSVQQIFEPGSSFKPITMAAGLDLERVRPETTYNDTGEVSSDGRTIKNFDERAYGVQTMAQVLEKSLNTGAVFVQRQVGDDDFLSHVINMGFGQKTGIDLPGEVSGDITNLYSGRKINYYTASFGQGIAVTPLQLIGAYSAIANGGRLMRPYVVDRIITAGGREIVTEPEIVGTPIRERTAQTLAAMLVKVVDNGFDKARIKGYDVAGKTGTAQIADVKGGYTENEFIHDFVGFAPASDPRFVVLLKMDRPQGITFAADSLSPAFKEIAAYLLNYYGVPPTRNTK